MPDMSTLDDPGVPGLLHGFVDLEVEDARRSVVFEAGVGADLRVRECEADWLLFDDPAHPLDAGQAALRVQLGEWRKAGLA